MKKILLSVAIACFSISFAQQKPKIKKSSYVVYGNSSKEDKYGEFVDYQYNTKDQTVTQTSVEKGNINDQKHVSLFSKEGELLSKTVYEQNSTKNDWKEVQKTSFSTQKGVQRIEEVYSFEGKKEGEASESVENKNSKSLFKFYSLIFFRRFLDGFCALNLKIYRDKLKI